MRKTSEEFNSDVVIENIAFLCKEPELVELPYWETINNYLKKVEPKELQEVLWNLVRHLLRCRAFEDARVQGKYWQILIDGTQIASSRKKLDGESLYRIHQKGTEKEYTEYYYYVLEAKVVLDAKIAVSIATEFVENEGTEAEKQDCERKACWRLFKKLKKEFPRLPICICGDSLYACERFFEECNKRHWHYVLRFKKGSIPSIYEDYEGLKGLEKNRQTEVEGKKTIWYDYVKAIDYRGYQMTVAEYGEEQEILFTFLTDLTVNKKNIKRLIEDGRKRWKIENEGFNQQKKHGYYLEHLYSHKYQAIKNHYYLIQIGHMISQLLENWKKLWKKVKQSLEQKHKRLLESFKGEKLEHYKVEIEKKIQIRLE